MELLEGRALLAADLVAANVLVLYNTASSDGVQIANYYAQIHPGVQLLGINGVDPNNEDISADAYLSIIRPQVVPVLTSTIDVIVTTKGLPLRITVQEAEPPVVSPNPLPTYVDPFGITRMILNWRPVSSLEGELTTIDTISTWQQMGDQSFQISGNSSINPYFRKNIAFSYAAFGDRLTARLDGYSVSDVEASLDRAQNAFIGPNNSPSGPYWFLVDNDPNIFYAPTMAKLVNNVLTPAGLPVVYDNTTAFVGTAPGPVIGYDSQGVHSTQNPGANYINSALNITLANGAVFNSWESYNAASFNTAGDTHGQGQVAQWLQKGGTAGVGNVDEPSAGPSYMVNENLLFSMLLSGKTFAEAAWSAIPQLSYVTTVVGDPLMTWQKLPPTPSTVAGRYLFYNNSFWDGNNPAANAADDASIAIDKTAYLPGSGPATFANVSSYDKGMNGVMVDLQGGGNHAAITLANILNDFTFKVGNNNSPGSWAAAPNPTAVTVRAGAGSSGSDRVELIWPDGAMKEQWLEVTVKATADTGLAANDVFFFGNALANSGGGDTANLSETTSVDELAARNNSQSLFNNIPVTNLVDYNRDGAVNSIDQLLARNNAQTGGATRYINIGAGGPFAPLPPSGNSVAYSGASPAAAGNGGVSSALVSSASPGPSGPAIGAWIVNRLSHVDLNSGPVAKYLEYLAEEDTAKSREILVKADQVADALTLDDTLLDSLLVNLG